MPYISEAWQLKYEGFLSTLEDWMEDLEPLTLESLLAEAGGPGSVAIFCVDMTNGFCHEGMLRSERVQALIEPIKELIIAAWEAGVRHFILPQDAHPADSPEFNDFPVHCIKGTNEAITIPELMSLPFSDHFTVMPKRSLSSSIGTDLDAWLDAHPEVTRRIVVGDCTDLCVYQLAMHLKLKSNALNLDQPVIVPANCVDTYDLQDDVAKDLGACAHPANLIHSLFLYHMNLNGVRVVSDIL